MSARARSAALCFALMFATLSVARADFAQRSKTDPGMVPDAVSNTIAPDYTEATAELSNSVPASTTPAPEAATMFLCGAGIMVIFAGMGIRRSAEQKNRK